ncbi:MAG: Ig-like domain-containing protein, partial [Actinomycetota bacterium]
MFKLFGVDDAANQGPAASFTFTVDTTGPVAAITGPTSTNDTTPTFSYTFNETITSGTRQCSLQPSGQPDSFASCSTSYTPPTPLADGEYDFKVRANDQLGNPGTTTHAVTIDGTAPTVTMTDGPASASNDTTPTFTFTTGDAVTIRCSLTLAGAANSFSDCTSPYEASTLADGAYEFKVRGTDSSGNVGSTTYAFTVDTTGPIVTISGAEQTTDTTPTFSFSFNEPVDPTSVECSLVPAGSPNSYVPCSSPFTQPTPLDDGSYAFRVRASDVLGNSGNLSTK